MALYKDVASLEVVGYTEPKNGTFSDGVHFILEKLDAIPKADVEPVRHGHWIKVFPRRTNRNATYKCSVCKKLRSSYYNDVAEWDRCPCGARMDGKETKE